MEADPPSKRGLCGYLRKIANLLESGQAIEAASVVAEMNRLLPTMPLDLSDSEVSESEGLLKHCRELEQGLRDRALQSMRQLGAARKSLAYRRARMPR